MKFQIKHECRGRIRVQAVQQRMTLEQADMLEAWLLTLPQVECASVHERTRCAVIEYQGERKDLLRILAGFSYQDHALAELVPVHSSRALNRAYEEKLVGMVAFKAVRSLFFPAPLRAVYTVIRSAPYLFRALRCLLRRQLHVELLDGISVCLSMVRRDFDTASSVMFLLRLGELLEEWTHKKSVENLARSMSLNIDRVWMKTESGEELVPLHQVQAGDQVVIRMGGMIPLDGTIAEGEVMLNQASLTGESIPVPKRPGSSVYAGTVVEEGECVLTVTQQSGKGRYDKIVAMIEESEQLKSTAENHAAHLADRLVPYTLAGSVLVYLLTRNVTRALSVLMVDFSCALKLSMPLAVLSAMSEASRFHVTVKGGKYLEAVAQADTIVFDKTGTLTLAKPKVADVLCFNGYDRATVLRYAACLEEHFPHSVANAIVRQAADEGLTHEEMHSKVEYIVAHGIASRVDGKRIVIGSGHFIFDDEKCVIPAGEEALYESRPEEYSHIYMALDGKLVAIICIQDPLRPEAPAVLRELRKAGFKQLVMMSGDSERTAAAVAAKIGVDKFYAEVLPEDKARFVKEAKASGHRVVMVGDGINDSPALSEADAGVAIAEGADIAREIADITISAHDLRQLVVLKQISTLLMKRVNFNYDFVVSFNAGLIGLGVMGILPPATTALLHNGSTIAISLHSMTDLMEA